FRSQPLNEILDAFEAQAEVLDGPGSFEAEITSKDWPCVVRDHVPDAVFGAIRVPGRGLLELVAEPFQMLTGFAFACGGGGNRVRLRHGYLLLGIGTIRH